MNTTVSRSLLVSAAATWLSLSARASPLMIVAGGKPRAIFVIEAHSTPAQRSANQELRAYIPRVTGASLPARLEPAASLASAIIAVGDTAAARMAKVGVAFINPEAFRIVRHGRAVFLLGRGAPGYEKFFKNGLGSGVEFAAPLT